MKCNLKTCLVIFIMIIYYSRFVYSAGDSAHPNNKYDTCTSSLSFSEGVQKKSIYVFLGHGNGPYEVVKGYYLDYPSDNQKNVYHVNIGDELFKISPNNMYEPIEPYSAYAATPSDIRLLNPESEPIIQVKVVARKLDLFGNHVVVEFSTHQMEVHATRNLYLSDPSSAVTPQYIGRKVEFFQFAKNGQVKQVKTGSIVATRWSREGTEFVIKENTTGKLFLRTIINLKLS